LEAWPWPLTAILTKEDGRCASETGGGDRLPFSRGGRARRHNAWPTLQKLGLVVPGASAQHMSFHRGVAAAVNGAEFVQQNGPEHEDLKIECSPRLMPRYRTTR
jgi:hypothetical protein